MEIARIPSDNAATKLVDGKVRQALGKIPAYKYGTKRSDWRNFYSSLKAHLQLAGFIDYAAGIDWAAQHPQAVHPSWNATLYSLLITQFDEIGKSMAATVPEGDGVALFTTAKFQAEGSMKILPQFIVEATNLNKLTFEETKETLNQYFERAQTLFELYSRHFSSALPHFMLCAYVLQGLPSRFQVLRDYIYMQYDKTSCHLMTFHTLILNWMHDNPVKVGGAFGVDVDKSKLQCFLCGAAGHGTKHCSARGALKDQKCPTCSAVGHNAAGCAAKIAYQERKAAANSGTVNFVLGVTDVHPQDSAQVHTAWTALLQFENSFLADDRVLDEVLDAATPVTDLTLGFPWSYELTSEYNYATQTFTRDVPVQLSVPWVFHYQHRHHGTPRPATGINTTILSGRAAVHHRRFLSERRRARKHRQLLKRLARARIRKLKPAALPEPRSKPVSTRFVGCVTMPPVVNSTSPCLAVQSVPSTPQLTFVVDSGASKTCINDPGVAHWLSHQAVEMRAANGSTISCPRSGLLHCSVDNFAFSLSDVVYAPEFTRNLLSLHSLVRSGVTCTVDSTATIFTFPCGTRLSAPLVDGCYLLQCSVVPVSGLGGTVFAADADAPPATDADAPLVDRLFAVGDLVMVPHTNWPTYSKAAKFPATGFERGRIIEFRKPANNVYRYRVHFDRTDNSKAIIHEDLILPDDPVGIHDCATCRTRFGDIAYNSSSGNKPYYTHASGFCTTTKPVIAVTPIDPPTAEVLVPRPIAEPKPTQRTKPRKSKSVSHAKDQPLGSRDLTVPEITTAPPIPDPVCSFPEDEGGVEFNDLDFDPSIVKEYSATTAHHSLLGDPAVYHARMSHLSLANTLKLQSVSDNFRLAHECATFCETCAICKLTRKDRYKWLPAETEPGVLYHSDSGRMDPASSSGYTSYFLFVEHCSTYVYLYVTKGETAEDLTECLKLLARDTGRMPRQLHSDCGSAYLADHTRKFCINNRIIQTFSTPYHKDENGIAEVATRTVKEGLRTLLVSSGVPLVLWPYALQVVVYTRNRAPLASRNNVTPYTILFSHQPNLDNLRVFGCSAYYLVQVPSNTVNGAFVPKARKGFMLGYNATGSPRAYLIGGIDKRGALTSRITADVVFNEKEFFFPSLPASFKLSTSLQCILEDIYTSEESQGDEAARDVLSVDAPTVDAVPPSPLDDLPSPVLSPKDPVNTRDAHSRSPEESKLWMESEDREWFDNILKNNVVRPIARASLPPGSAVLRSMMVYKVKRSGEYKTRCVVMGQHEPESNIRNTFAPTTNEIIFRLLVAVNYVLKHADPTVVMRSGDVSNAFAHTPLPGWKRVYMTAPIPRLSSSTDVYELLMALYGLRESPRFWALYLMNILAGDGWIQSDWEPCLYFKRDSADRLVAALTVFVDDVLFVGPLAMWTALLKHVNLTVPLNDLGEPRDFLGVTISVLSSGTYLSMPDYIRGMLERFSITGTPKSTPMVHEPRLPRESDRVVDPSKFQQMAGTLLHLMRMVRPDIAYATHEVCKHLLCHSKVHFDAMDRVYRYLGHSSHAGLFCSSSPLLAISIYCDSDWASDLSTRHSTTGFLIVVNELPLVWYSRAQKSVSLSSCEAELFAISQGLRIVRWLRRILLDFRLIASDYTFVVHCDSQSAIALCTSESGSSPHKHIDIRLKHIREMIVNKEVQLVYIPSRDNLADVLTKPLPLDSFQLFTARCLRSAPLESTVSIVNAPIVSNCGGA
jgi:hypothetical protein